MRYGVCNWVFDGVELRGDLRLYEPASVNAILGDHGLVVLSLTPEGVDLAHPDAVIRAEALDYYLRLLDFAAAVGAPMICCHGAVGRVRPLADLTEEMGYLRANVQRIAARAAPLGLRVAMEVLNRYESHLLNTAAQAVEFYWMHIT
jgi:D-psicose/D-tagatose/L-ribulose 3-epimerase